jgi:outer membrane protein assembly factor BamD
MARPPAVIFGILALRGFRSGLDLWERADSVVRMKGRLHAFVFLLAVIALSAAARADLVWGPDTGWRIEGGALSGLTGAQGRDALDLMNKARADEERHSFHAALKAYAKVTKKYSSSIYAPEAYYRTATIRLARKQYFKAFDAYQAIIVRYPNVKRFNEILGEEYGIASALLNGARNRVLGFLPLFASRDKGVQYCEAILANAPYGDYAPLVLMESARGRQYLGDTEEAIDALDRFINSYAQNPMTPDAYLRLALLHASLVQGPAYDQAETKQAITYCEDFTILFPNDPKIADAARGLDKAKSVLAESKIKIGDFFFYKRGNYTAARVFYNEAITAYPDSDVANQAKKRLVAVEAKASAAAKGFAPKKHHFLFF